MDHAGTNMGKWSTAGCPVFLLNPIPISCVALFSVLFDVLLFDVLLKFKLD